MDSIRYRTKRSYVLPLSVPAPGRVELLRLDKTIKVSGRVSARTTEIVQLLRTANGRPGLWEKAASLLYFYRRAALPPKLPRKIAKAVR